MDGNDRVFPLSFPNKALIGGSAVVLLGLAILDAYVVLTDPGPFTLATGTEIDPNLARWGMALAGAGFLTGSLWILLALCQAVFGQRVLRLGSGCLSAPNRPDSPLIVRIPYAEVRGLGITEDHHGRLWLCIGATPMKSVRLPLDCFEYHDVVNGVIDEIVRRREAAVGEMFT